MTDILSPADRQEAQDSLRIYKAGPDMLAALKLFIRNVEYPGVVPSVYLHEPIKAAKAAIAKAEHRKAVSQK